MQTILPEEQVRRWIIGVLVDAGVDRHRIACEYSINIGGRRLRIDVAVFGYQSTQISAIIECKAPTVTLSQETINQASIYNSAVGARYLIATNGSATYIYDSTEKRFISHFPSDL